MSDSDAAGPRGVPATGAGPIADLIAADPPPQIRSSFTDLLDQALAAPRVPVTRQEVWVDEPGTFAGGHWEEVVA
jgi:hypothetical protein